MAGGMGVVCGSFFRVVRARHGSVAGCFIILAVFGDIIMQLTQRQEWQIERRVREIDSALARRVGPQSRARDAAVARLRGRIEGELARFGDATVTDGQVEEVLGRLGAPEDTAESLLRGVSQRTPEGAPPAEPRWLGVCLALSREWGMPLLGIRAAFSAAGLVAAPLALSAYAGAYFYFRARGAHGDRPQIRWVRLAWGVLITLAVCVLLHLGGGQALRGMHWLMDVVVKRPMPELGEWGWFVRERGTLMALALFCAVPASFLGGLPMVNGWDTTLRRCSQAVLALYAVAVSFGLASVVAGIILRLVREFSA